MGLLNKKSLWQRILNSRLTIILLFVAVFALSFAVYNRYVVEQDVLERRMETEKELIELKARQVELADKVEYLSNEQGFEAEIRRHFDVSREGEQVVVLVGSVATSAPTTPIGESGSDNRGFWRSIIPW